MNYSIYTITNISNGKVYVGVTKQKPEHRWIKHLYWLRNNRRPNPELQDDFNRLGEDKFAFQVIEQIDIPDKLSALEIETQWINAFPDVYNTLKNEKKIGSKQTKEHKEHHKEAMRLTQKNAWLSSHSPEEVQAYRDALAFGKECYKGWMKTSKKFGVDYVRLSKFGAGQNLDWLQTE